MKVALSDSVLASERKKRRERRCSVNAHKIFMHNPRNGNTGWGNIRVNLTAVHTGVDEAREPGTGQSSGGPHSGVGRSTRFPARVIPTAAIPGLPKLGQPAQVNPAVDLIVGLVEAREPRTGQSSGGPHSGLDRSTRTPHVPQTRYAAVDKRGSRSWFWELTGSQSLATTPASRRFIFISKGFIEHFALFIICSVSDSGLQGRCHATRDSLLPTPDLA